jgi:hypothetical protein
VRIVPRWHRAPADAAAYAHDLYAVLRTLDVPGTEVIVVEQPPPGVQWSAVHDRLLRAAADRPAGAPAGSTAVADPAPAAGRRR